MPVSYPRWEGNVWDHLKKLCTAVGGELNMVGEFVVFREPRQRTIPIENRDGIVRTVDAQATALNVEIYNYNSRWLSDAVAYTATSAYTIAAGEGQEFYVPTTASLGSVNSPRAVAEMTDDYSSGTGQYVVIDSNSNVVAPNLWDAAGGVVVAQLDPTHPGEIKVTMYAPYSVSTYEAPFRIARADGTAALAITGSGVFINKELVRIPTGATITQTSTDVAATVDNVFLSNAGQTADRGILSAMRAGGPSVSVTGEIGYDPISTGQEFGNVVGSRISFDFAMYRITSATYRSGGISFTADADTIFGDVTAAYSMTFGEFNAANDGLTFTAFNALWPGATFDSFASATNEVTFDNLNAIYEGLTFNDYAIFPLMTQRLTTNAEARQ